MEINWGDIKKKLIIFGVVYVIFTIIIVGTFLVSVNEIDGNIFANLTLFSEKFSSNIVNPFSVIGRIFSDSKLTSDFFTWAGITFVGFVIGFIYSEHKAKKKYDFEGEEHGSSDWSKGSQEFIKTPDGKEIINRKNGFILSKNHYLGTDLRKVAINKNILVFGGSGTRKNSLFY